MSLSGLWGDELARKSQGWDYCKQILAVWSCIIDRSGCFSNSHQKVENTITYITQVSKQTNKPINKQTENVSAKD